MIDTKKLQNRLTRCDKFTWLPTLRVNSDGWLNFLDPMTLQTLLSLVRFAYRNPRVCVEFRDARWVVYTDSHGFDTISRDFTEAGALVRALEKAHGEIY